MTLRFRPPYGGFLSILISRLTSLEIGLSDVFQEQNARKRRTTPRTRSLKESVSIAGLKVTSRETVASISPN